MDYTLELIVVPVSDVDRAKAFYLDQAGFELLVDSSAGPDFRVVQLVRPARPARSRSAPASGRWPRARSTACTSSSATSSRRARSCVAAGSSSATRSTSARPARPRASTRSAAPTRRSCRFQDPDGNTWLVQEVKRDWKVQVVKLDEVAA